MSYAKYWIKVANSAILQNLVVFSNFALNLLLVYVVCQILDKKEGSQWPNIDI